MNRSNRVAVIFYLFIYLYHEDHVSQIRPLSMEHWVQTYCLSVGRCRSKLNAKYLICLICAANHLQFFLIFGRNEQAIFKLCWDKSFELQFLIYVEGKLLQLVTLLIHKKLIDLLYHNTEQLLAVWMSSRHKWIMLIIYWGVAVCFLHHACSGGIIEKQALLLFSQ